MKYLLLAASALAVVACGKKDKVEEGESSGAQSAFQSQRSQAETLASSEFSDALLFSAAGDFMSSFYVEEGTPSSEETTTEADCSADDVITKASASGKHLVLTAVFTADTACNDQRRATAKSDVETQGGAIYAQHSSVDMQATLDCEKDVSSLDGQTIADNFDLNAACGKISGIVSSYKIVGELTLYLPDASGAIEETKGSTLSEYFLHSSDGSACTYTYSGEEGQESAGCLMGYFSSIQGAGDFDGVSYLHQKRNGMTGNAADPWYTSGTIDFELNNWSGTMTYSGGTTAPSWTASDGKTKLKGTLDPTVGLKAMKPKLRSGLRLQSFGLLNQ